jgi:hypothetical protein
MRMAIHHRHFSERGSWKASRDETRPIVTLFNLILEFLWEQLQYQVKSRTIIC